MSKSNKKLSKKVDSVVKSFVDEQSFKTDPNGSYTGRPADKDEKPVQDVDDL